MVATTSRKAISHRLGIILELFLNIIDSEWKYFCDAAKQIAELVIINIDIVKRDRNIKFPSFNTRLQQSTFEGLQKSGK